MSDFQKLEIWKQAHELTIAIYKLTSKLPKEEMFGLISQMRRAAVSVESNIAEGESRYSSKDKLNFFTMARGSIGEICTQLLVVRDIYTDLSKEANEINENYQYLGKRITSLIKYRKTKKSI